MLLACVVVDVYAVKKHAVVVSIRHA